jgi:hypothetical protein
MKNSDQVVLAHVNSSGFIFIRPEFFDAIKEVSKKMRISSSPQIKGLFQNWEERQSFPYWFLIHHVCMNGAQIVSRHSDLEPDDAIMSKSLGPSYKICLNPADTLDDFCKRFVSSDYFIPSSMGIYIEENGWEEPGDEAVRN